MSSFTLRSPSPNQNRSTSTNRSGRSPERSSLGRKSVDLSNYSLKLGSPSDFSHRSSSPKHFSSPSDSSHKISNSNSRHTFSWQKENTERLSTPKGRSPVVTSQKGFMAPTISASSKGRSPVLKHPRVILSEHNQNQAKTEEIFSPNQNPITKTGQISSQIQNPTKTEELFSPNQNPPTKTEQISSQIQNPTKRDEIFSPNQNPITKTEEVSSQIQNPTKTEEISSQNQNPITKTDETIISPYDPKTNYLSSRPQYFLYTPIPRIEMHKRGELDLFDPRNLEDSFSSDESDESDETEETKTDAVSSEIDLSKTGISIPGSSEIDLPKNGISNLGSSEVDDLVQIGISIPSTSESELPKTGISNPDSSETDLPETGLRIPVLNAGATKRIKLKIAPLMVVLILGCIFIPLSDSPVLNSDSNLKYPYLQFGTFDAKLMEISSKLSQWSTQSMQYFNKIFERDASFQTQIGGGPFPLANLSLQILNESGDNLDSNPKPSLNGFEKVERERFKIGNFETETGFGSESKSEFESNKVVENQQVVNYVINNELDNGFASEPVKIENPIESSNNEIVNKVDNGFDSESVKIENPVESSDVETVIEHVNGFDYEPVKVENNEASVLKTDNEPVKAENINELDNGFESKPVNREKTDNEIDNGFESDEPVKVEKDNDLKNEVDNNGFGYLPVKEKLISNPLMGIIVALVAILSLVLISAAYVKKNRVSVSKPTNENATPVEEKPCISNSCSGSSESLKTRASLLENSSVDMEFSASFDRTNLSTGTSLKSYYSRERVARRESEVSTGTNMKNYSSERVARRESEVSSGSFGSFTSYEKIASKKVNGDEITTPVRRSSRIASKKD